MAEPTADKIREALPVAQKAIFSSEPMTRQEQDAVRTVLSAAESAAADRERADANERDAADGRERVILDEIWVACAECHIGSESLCIASREPQGESDQTYIYLTECQFCVPAELAALQAEDSDAMETILAAAVSAAADRERADANERDAATQCQVLAGAEIMAGRDQNWWLLMQTAQRLKATTARDHKARRDMMQRAADAPRAEGPHAGQD